MAGDDARTGANRSQTSSQSTGSCGRGRESAGVFVVSVPAVVFLVAGVVEVWAFSFLLPSATEADADEVENGRL